MRISDFIRLSTLRHMLLKGGVAWLVVACATTPPVQSPTMPAPPSTPSTSGGPSSSTPPSTSSSTSSGSGGLTRPPAPARDSAESAGSGQQSSPDQGQGGQTGSPAGAAQAGDSQPPGGTAAGEQKTDDEILAEALEQFGRSAPATATAGNGDRAVADAKAAGTDTGSRTGIGTGTGATSESLPGGTAGGGVLTDAEKAQLLNRDLERKFAEFDELMRNEREAVARQDNAGGGGGGGSLGGGQGGQEGPQEAALSDSGMPPPPVASRSSGVPGTGNNDIPVEIPSDVGSIHDDDIIARQLREAAMKEQDPVLREKLWNEYRKYKSGGA